jgi:stage II sporulation protein D
VASGRGFGHGVGMSQWGAYGLALRGQGHEQILRYFYRGVEVRPSTPR